MGWDRTREKVHVRNEVGLQTRVRTRVLWVRDGVLEMSRTGEREDRGILGRGVPVTEWCEGRLETGRSSRSGRGPVPSQSRLRRPFPVPRSKGSLDRTETEGRSVVW